MNWPWRGQMYHMDWTRDLARSRSKGGNCPCVFANEMLRRVSGDVPISPGSLGPVPEGQKCNIPSPGEIGVVDSASEILVTDSIYDLAM